jgi:ribosomal protein S18 acetylase RimI-like enzyme
MTDCALLARLCIEPLDRRRHDRSTFSSGVGRVDRFLQTLAASQQDSGVSRTTVAVEDGDREVVGFHTLCAHSIEARSLPEDLVRRLPRHPLVPAVYLGFLGVDVRFQGRGVGSFLMADAFARSVQAADILGAGFLVLDALNEDAARLYRRLGFVDLPGHAPRMLISLAQVRKAIRAAELQAA